MNQNGCCAIFLLIAVVGIAVLLFNLPYAEIFGWLSQTFARYWYIPVGILTLLISVPIIDIAIESHQRREAQEQQRYKAYQYRAAQIEALRKERNNLKAKLHRTRKGWS